MIKDEFIFDKEINKDISSAYFGFVYHIKYKDKYRFESDVIPDDTKDTFFIRSAFNDDNKDDMFQSATLIDTMRFLPLPYIPRENEKERSVFYVCGASGEGKSFLVNKVCELYHILFPKNKIYFLTMEIFW